MASYSKRSYGARLGSAHELLTYISGFENFSPTKPEDSIESMKTLIDELLAVNSTVVSNNESYKTAVDIRANAFNNSENSVQKLLIQIKAAVESQYDKKSTEATVLNRIIKRMRAVKVKKSSGDPSTEEGEKAANRSNKSYGTKTQFFNDIVTTLEKFKEYQTSNERVKVPVLRETALKLALFNAEVAKTMLDSKTAGDQRRIKFEELRVRSVRIKTYVKGQYGIDSKEYALIKGLQF